MNDTWKKREVLLTDDWRFHLGAADGLPLPSLDDSGWRRLDLPHDFSIEQPFDASLEAESAFLPGGAGCYRKHLTVPKELAGKRLILNFDGAYENTRVWANGRFVGENHYGYNRFSFDVTGDLICDGETDNVIAVEVVHEIPSSRWYSGSGLYRDVSMTVTGQVHIASDGVVLSAPEPENLRGSVELSASVTVRNDGAAPAGVVPKIVLTAPDGTDAATAEGGSVTVPAGGETTIRLTAAVGAPLLWSVRSPNLYTVRTELSADGETADSLETPFGFRWFRFNPDTGFALNGEKMKLQGVCMHHDQGALGSAAYEDALRRQIVILKGMGCNAVRTSHNIASRNFIELCDRLGMLVMEEAFDGWSGTKGGNTHDFSEYFLEKLPENGCPLGGVPGERWYEYVLRTMVLRDRNDPCVIIWDVGNEIVNTPMSTDEYPAYAARMAEIVHALDASRPVTHGDNGGLVTNTDRMAHKVTDVLCASGYAVAGYNYWAENTTVAHEVYPERPIIMTESVSMLTTRGAYSLFDHHSDEKWACPAYTTGRYSDTVTWGATAYDDWYQVATRDYVAGDFIWTGFDYIGEPNPWWSEGAGPVTVLGAAPNSSTFGVVDTAGFPKDSYYFYRSQWEQRDVTLHLVTAWDPDNLYRDPDGRTPVWIYTNAPSVALYRNGVLIGRAQGTLHTTAAGHSCTTYAAESADESVCAAVTPENGHGADLYAAFWVDFQPGEIRAEAFGRDGRPIRETVGNAVVRTPGGPSVLRLTADRQESPADGRRLTYVTVDVTDADGTLLTASDAEIRFTLDGGGEIMGVDNGDQASMEKYRQPTVLLSPRLARVRAYAGKALAVVRSLRGGGSFTLTASAEGMEPVGVTVRGPAEN